MLPSETASPRADARPFPDVILRSQFFELIGTHSLSSEQRLMLAVLADAINIVQDFHHSEQTARKRGPVSPRPWSGSFAAGRKVSARVRECVRRARDRRRRLCDGAYARLFSGDNKEARVAPLRLRLKEASRVQRLTVNRVRRRRKKPRNLPRPLQPHPVGALAIAAHRFCALSLLQSRPFFPA